MLFPYKTITQCLCAITIISAPALSAVAQTLPQGQDRSAVRLSLGYHNQYKRVEIAYETPSLFQTTLFNHPFDIKLEASLAYWHTSHKAQQGSHNKLWQLGITPMMRWWINDRWYLEGGIGATFMSHSRFANKTLSTSFQFGDHIGIVRTFGNDWRAGLRLSHFSNASIKKPNAGLNIIQLNISKLF